MPLVGMFPMYKTASTRLRYVFLSCIGRVGADQIFLSFVFVHVRTQPGIKVSSLVIQGRCFHECSVRPVVFKTV